MLINFLFSKDANIKFENNFYSKKINNEIEIFYPNKRITRVINAENFIFQNIYDAYCLDKVNFKTDDLIIDCGANVGELNISLKLRGLNVRYFGIEPDKSTFECLLKNKLSEGAKFKNIALSNSNGNEKLFLDNLGGNSSIIFFGNDEYDLVETKTLDSFNISEKIKLFKIEAEGYEPEVLEGSNKTLKLVEFVTIDFGSERGEKQENTVVQSNNILTSNGFELVDFSNIRTIGLYKNKAI
tara:strand:- start:1723 stop:2445 length:723 start_codon:yes stop_codon:yes gene_type:complete